jgi:hypothetical protein
VSLSSFHPGPDRFVGPIKRVQARQTSACLLARSDFGLPAVFLVRPDFFAGLVFLAGLRLALGCSASGAGVPLSIESLIIAFSLSGVAVVTFIALVQRNSKQNLRD